jgi:peptide chain release factor subunit 1
MFTESNLRELLEFTSPQPMLSLYLNTDTTEGNTDAYKLQLRNMLKEVKLPQDVEAVERYMSHEFKREGRSVAIFSCAERNFLRAYPLAIAVDNLVHIANRPSVKTLADLLDNFGGYGVAVVDRQGARLFFFHLGELREQEGMVGEAIKHTKRGGASTFPGRRGGIAGQTQYEDEMVERNMRDAAEFAAHFFEENHVRRVLIGGTDDTVALFRSMLPKAWQSLVKGSFPMSMNASHSEVLSHTLSIGQETERQREVRLVDNLLTAAGKGANADVGLEKILPLAHEGRIQSLILAQGFKQPGYLCPDCSRLSLEPGKYCTDCKSDPTFVTDIVELLVSDVLRRGGDVEVVHAETPLKSHGSAGALLRY